MVAPRSYPLAVSCFTLHGKGLPVRVETFAALPSPSALTRLQVRLVVALLRCARSDARTGGPPSPRTAFFPFWRQAPLGAHDLDGMVAKVEQGAALRPVSRKPLPAVPFRAAPLGASDRAPNGKNLIFSFFYFSFFFFQRRFLFFFQILMSIYRTKSASTSDKKCVRNSDTSLTYVRISHKCEQLRQKK